MIEQSDARHQTYANLEALWSAGSPQVLPLSGTPWCEIRLDPGAGVITLRTLYQSKEPDLAKLRNVSFEAITEAGLDTAEIAAQVGDNLIGIYGLLAAVADGVQLGGSGLAAAVNLALERYKDVLSQRVRLSDQIEIGLFGELKFLRHLMERVGIEKAISSWLGPMSEEHDFVLPEIHVEVKTTTSERRLHVISGLAQLAPVPNIPLAVLSIQLTRATPETGQTLPSLIAELRQKASAYSVELERKLGRLGWNSEDADLYGTPWTMRSAPRVYDVDSSFPAVTSARIGDTVPNLALVSNVSYRVDLTELAHTSLPIQYDGFQSSEEKLT